MPAQQDGAVEPQLVTLFYAGDDFMDVGRRIDDGDIVAGRFQLLGRVEPGESATDDANAGLAAKSDHVVAPSILIGALAVHKVRAFYPNYKAGEIGTLATLWREGLAVQDRQQHGC